MDPPIREKLHNGFDNLSENLPLRNIHRLVFRSSGFFGPNAFALPGGIIVIIDALVEASETEEEILAVLAHGIGHVEMRHAVRNMLQNSVIAAADATITAAAPTLSAAVASLSVILARTKYSREFETAADDFAFRLLKQKESLPGAFALIMERLAAESGQESSGFNYPYFES